MTNTVHWTPNPGQQTFALAVDGIRELLYGGARGGGKTDAGMVWLVLPPYIQHARYRGLVIRRNVDDLRDWIDRAKRMYMPLKAEFAGWPPEIRFPQGGIIRTGHLKDDQAYTKYQGHEYHQILIEELTQIPSEARFESVAASCRSSLPELTPRIFCTANPGGPGHQWVKLRWRIGKGGHAPNVAFRIPTDARLRMYVPATMDDNPPLMKSDPAYSRMIESLPEPLRSAWRYGDWDIFMGQAFAFDPERHVLKTPPPVPSSARLLFTFDWGFAKPYSMGWWWVDEEQRLYRFAEVYGMGAGEPDTGLRQTDDVQVQEVIRMEKAQGIWGRPITRLSDPTCFNRKPDYRGGGQGPSTADVFASAGVHLTPGDPSRILKIRQFHARLRVPDAAAVMPMLVVYPACVNFIRTIPTLQGDPKHPEDIVTDNVEDHVYDEAALACMALPVGGGGGLRQAVDIKRAGL